MRERTNIHRQWNKVGRLLPPPKRALRALAPPAPHFSLLPPPPVCISFGTPIYGESGLANWGVRGRAQMSLPTPALTTFTPLRPYFPPLAPPGLPSPQGADIA